MTYYRGRCGGCPLYPDANKLKERVKVLEEALRIYADEDFYGSARQQFDMGAIARTAMASGEGANG